MKNEWSLISPFWRNAQQTSVNTALWCSGSIYEAELEKGYFYLHETLTQDVLKSKDMFLLIGLY